MTLLQLLLEYWGILSTNRFDLLKIRFSLRGKKGQPSYDIVVQEHTAPIKGKFIEKLGFYQPAQPGKPYEVDTERVAHWLSVGAKPSPSAASLLKKAGVAGMDEYLEVPERKAEKKNPDKKA